MIINLIALAKVLKIDTKKYQYNQLRMTFKGASVLSNDEIENIKSVIVTETKQTLDYLDKLKQVEQLN